MVMTLGEFGVESDLRLWPQQQRGQFCSTGFQKLIKLRDMCCSVWWGGGGGVGFLEN